MSDTMEMSLLTNLLKKGLRQPPGSGDIKPMKAIFKKKINKHLYKEWGRRWNKSVQCWQTKLFFPDPNPKASKFLIKLDRNHLSMAVRFLTGHNFLNRHNKLLNPNLNISKLCRNCGEEEETSDHIINRCPQYGLHRYGLHGKTESNPEDWMMTDLVRFLSKPEVIALETNNEFE